MSFVLALVILDILAKVLTKTNWNEMVEGKEDIMRILNDEIQLGGQDIKFETLELVINGDFAYETGLYSVNMKHKGQAPVSDKGKYIVIWEKQSDGQWLMDKDIWNSDLPVNRKWLFSIFFKLLDKRLINIRSVDDKSQELKC